MEPWGKSHERLLIIFLYLCNAHVGGGRTAGNEGRCVRPPPPHKTFFMKLLGCSSGSVHFIFLVQVHLIGHDWGAALVYLLAANVSVILRPEHPDCLLSL